MIEFILGMFAGALAVILSAVIFSDGGGDFEAAEKQIPKKPTPHIVKTEKIKIRNGYWGKNTTIYKCPCCDGFISITNKHCHECGQKIDWGSKD